MSSDVLETVGTVVAVPGQTCDDCVLYGKEYGCLPCEPEERDDNANVIYKIKLNDGVGHD